MRGPLFKWFGSKWLSAKYLPAPQHEFIFEPYAGSAGYSLRHADRKVTLWDADPNLQQLWRWLIKDATSDDVRDIPLGLPEGTDIRALGLSAGQALLLKHWQRTNNVGDCWTTSPWGNKPGQWTANTRARVAEDIYRVKHWRLAPPAPNNVGTYFIDPPYQHNYRYRPGLGFSHEACREYIESINFESQLIVCEARCPKTGAAPDWLLGFVDWQKRVTSRRKAGNNTHSREMILHREARIVAR